MPHRHAISDADWERLAPLLPGQPGQHGGVAEDNRRFLDTVLWVARTGAAWAGLSVSHMTGTPAPNRCRCARTAARYGAS